MDNIVKFNYDWKNLRFESKYLALKSVKNSDQLDDITEIYKDVERRQLLSNL